MLWQIGITPMPDTDAWNVLSNHRGANVIVYVIAK